MKTSICKCGLIDGCVNALLCFLALDIATSTLVTGYDVGLIVICVCAVLSAVLFFFLAKRTYDSIARCFWTGLLYFVLAGIVLFFCRVAGLHLFPRREMADAEGIMLLLFDGLYLTLSVILRVVYILLAKLKTAKTNP
jgi:hypothetical protein